MPITLSQEFVSGNEASISWVISPDLLSSSSKPILCLSDINQSSPTNSFPIAKYQIRPNEQSEGLYTFANLAAGEYVAEIIIISGNSSVKSSPLAVTVYQVDVPQFAMLGFMAPDGIIPGNKKFTISLTASSSDMTNGTVTFILFGQPILGGDTQLSSAGTVNMVFPYNVSCEYVVDDASIENDVEYEISCFYTNSVGISGELSASKIKRPTNIPNQITTISSVYDAVAQTLTINHNMPSNAADYDLDDLRATITDANDNVTYYYSSENSAELLNAPTASDPVVFNMQNQNLLSVDIPFTITLAAKNEIGNWAEVESPAVTCIHPVNFCAVPLVVNDLSFSVGLTNISTTDNQTYSKNVNYDINYTAKVYECFPNGNIIGSEVASITQTNDMNFVFNNLVTGQLHKMFINLSYTYTFADNSTVTIEQNIMDTCFKYFIPHDIPNALTISATPGDQQIYVNWGEITVQNLNGFLLDHYELSSDNINWVNKGTSLSHTFTGLINGAAPYTYFVKAVSYSGTSFYMSGETVEGLVSDVTAVPYGNPDAPILVSQLPGDSKCTIVWSITADPYNGGLFDSFEASVNSSSFTEIVPSLNNGNGEYTYEFTGLTNLSSSSIQIRVVNKNQPNLNNVDTTKNSANLSVVTIPFAMPHTPAGLATSPDTNSVALSWTAVLPAEIINESVEYELYYKLKTDSDFTVVSNIGTNSYLVTGLTSNSMYEFKIRSTIYNLETTSTFNSAFSSLVEGRPFIYANAPNMVLEAGSNTVIVKLSSNVSNFFQSKFNYYATISNVDDSNPKNLSLTNVTTTDVQTITFTVLGDNSGLVNLTDYKVVAYYETFNTDKQQFYASNSVSNTIQPFSSGLAPVLSSVSGNTVVDLTWDISSFAGYTINEYSYSYDNSSWDTIAMNAISQVALNRYTTTIPNLVNGASYNFYVKLNYTVNSETYDSVPSNMVTNIPYTYSDAPTILDALAASQKITLSWSAPTDFGGLSIHHYEVKKDIDTVWTSVASTLFEYEFTGLTNATLYTVYVRAVTLNVLEGNVYVLGDSASQYNIPYAIPAAPAFVTCVEGDEELRLTWNIDVTGSKLDFFDFHVFMGSYDGGVNWFRINDTQGFYGDELYPAFLFSGLTNGQQYTLKVYAVITHPVLGNIDGNILTVGPFVPYVKASAPAFVSCVEGNTTLNLTWAAPASLGGLVFSHYLVSHDNVNWTNVGAVLSHVFTGLTNGQSYTLRVKAVTTHINLGEIDGTMFTSTAFVPYSTAIAPTYYSSATISRNGDSNPTKLVIEIRLLPGTRVDDAWIETVGANTGGLPVTGYEYSLDNTVWMPMVNTANNGDYSLTVIGAGYYPYDGIYFSTSELGNTKTVRARAVCTHPNLGLIPGASFSRDALVYVIPSKPIFNTITAGDQSLTVTWQAMVPYVSGLPNVDGVLNGLPLSKYQVAQNYYGNGTFWIDVDASTTTYTFTGLTNGTSYQPLVRAIGYDEYKNIGGPGVATLVVGNWATSSANTPYKPASAPTLNSVQEMDTQIRLTWNAADLNGLSLVRYQVSLDASSWTDSVGNANYTDSETTPSFLFTSLTNGNSYNIFVRAITSHPLLGEIVGDTFESIAYYPFKTPSAPSLNVVPSNHEIVITWTTPDLGGLTFFDNQISYNGGASWDTLSYPDPSLIYSSNNVTNSVTFSGLTNGQAFTYRIRVLAVHNNLGLRASPPTVASAYPFVKPGVVSDIVATATNGSLSFSFTAPANLNDNNITENYEYSIDNEVTWNALYQLTSLTRSIGNDAFSLKIRAYIVNPNDNVTRVNGDITSLDNLQNVSITTPQNLMYAFADGSVSLFWDEVQMPGVQYQMIQYFDNGSTTKVLTSNNYYTFSGLTNGVAYKFGVNIYTNGSAGPVSNVTVTPMVEPTIRTVSKIGDILSVDINFGGSPTVRVMLTASAVVVINGQQYIPVNGGQVKITVDASSNPVTFSGMSSRTRFDVVVSNTVGIVNGTYVR